MTAAELSPSVRSYLGEVERELKQIPGVAPEDILADVRDRILAHGDDSGDLETTWGRPAEVVAGYAAPDLGLEERKGFAPGWRICCTRCGRSAPLDRLRAVRVGGRSAHKYTVGWCRNCRGLRWLRIIQDLEQANLTDRLGTEGTPDEVRRAMHRPWTVLCGILALTLGILAVVFGGVGLVVRMFLR